MSSFFSRFGSLIRELRGRHVFRVIVVYAIVAWIVVEVADVTFPKLQLPGWAPTLVLVLAILGFPIALVLAWAFELTPEGVRRTERADFGIDGRGLGRGARTGWAIVGLAVLAGAAWWTLRPSGPGEAVGVNGADRKSVAVLPFSNMVADSANRYFADGITEDVTSQLALIEGLSVPSRTSVIRYAGTDLASPEIAEQLGVRYLLTGSVRKSEDRILVVASLIDAGKDEVVWTERYDRRLEDVFQIQAELARRIAAGLDAALAPDVADRIEHRPTGNMEAYELYLRARELSGRSREANDTAITLLERAMQIDPDFAPVYMALSRAYMFRVQDFGGDQAWADSGLVLAHEAIALDPGLAEAYGSALAPNHAYLGRLEDARSALRRALQLKPNYGYAMMMLGFTELLVGRPDVALEQLQSAQPLMPGSYLLAINMAAVHRSLGLDREAERWLVRAEQLNPGGDAPYHRIYLDLARGELGRAVQRADAWLAQNPMHFLALVAAADVALFQGESERAREHLERAHAMAPEAVPNALTMFSPRLRLAYVLMKMGYRQRGSELLDASVKAAVREIESGNEWSYIRLELAAAHAIRGARMEAYSWLTRAVDRGFLEYRLIDDHPLFENLQGERHFEGILAGLERRLQRMRTDLAAQADGPPDGNMRE